MTSALDYAHHCQDGPARPLEYPKAETPTWGGPAGPDTPSPPKEGGLPAGRRCVGAVTGPADSVDTDSGPPTAAALGLTNVEEEGVAATKATSLGSTSLPSNSLRARERVKW